MKFKEKTNKVISFMLAIATVISTLSPAFTSTVNAERYFNTVEPKVEYSDSGEVPEEVVTGTDFDNFSISLQYGYVPEDLGDTVLLTDAEMQVPITINIEYRGDQSYEAGAISFTMEDLETLLRDPDMRYNPYTDCHSVDIGAELVGSGSGRGDWYYTVTESANKTENSKYVFTNKNTTTGAFTSSIEFVISLNYAEHLISGYEQTTFSTLTVGENSKKSNNLYFKYKSTPNTFDVTSVKQENYIYYTYSKDSCLTLVTSKILLLIQLMDIN